MYLHFYKKTYPCKPQGGTCNEHSPSPHLRGVRGVFKPPDHNFVVLSLMHMLPHGRGSDTHDRATTVREWLNLLRNYGDQYSVLTSCVITALGIRTKD
jgi:hypothetical protein